MVAGNFQDAKNEIALKYPRKLSLRNLWPRFSCAKGNLGFRTTLDPFKGGYVVKEATGYFRHNVDGALVKANLQSSLGEAPLGWGASETEELPSVDGKYLAVIKRTDGQEGRLEIEAGRSEKRGSYARIRLYGKDIPAGPDVATYLAYELVSSRNS